MSRIPLIRSHQLPYHLYGRSNNREWFYLPLGEVWEVFKRHLSKATEDTGFQVHAFVLMSNHYHIIATAAGASVDQVMCRVLKGTSDDINKRACRINHVFGGPYKWTLIEHWFHYHHVFRYVYQNPLRAELCRSVELYPFSTIQHLLCTPSTPVTLTSHPFERTALSYIRGQRHEDWLSWLNEPYDRDHVEALRRALYRRRFSFGQNRMTRKIPRLFLESNHAK